MKEPKTEHPILFSTPMVQALLEGRKTMTRRIFKDHPRLATDVSKIDLKQWLQDYPDLIMSYSPYGQPGDKLWVREAFTVLAPEHCIGGWASRFIYKADATQESEEIMKYYILEYGYPYNYKPSIHMPKAAARIWLEITNIRVERLQDISFEDAIAEGIEIVTPDQFGFCYKNYEKLKLIPVNCRYPQTSFFSLWNKINGHESFLINPWVWVIEFKRISHNS